MKYYIVDAFTDQSFGGNPAGVVLLEGEAFPTEELMLKIAAELRYSETAFVRRHTDSEYTVRYFTPKAEVDLCGHATIASFSLLYQLQLAKGECICHTLAGDLRIEVDEKVLMQMATPRIVETIADTKEIYSALGVMDYQPTLPVQIASTGLSDIMIPLHDVAMLQSLKPDMEAITAITRKYKAVSFHVFALEGDSYTAHVRDFAPLYDIPEESATGTANAALTHYLQHNGCIPSSGNFTFLQGESMGRPSVVATRITKDGNIYVGGTAAIVAKGDLVSATPLMTQHEMEEVKQVESTELTRTSQSWDGVELPDYLQGRPELVAMKYVFPAGKKLGWHHHEVMNYGVLVHGELTIVCQDGTEKVVHAGEAVVEMIGTVHHGENRGTVPAILYMFYLSQKDVSLSVQHPEIPIE